MYRYINGNARKFGIVRHKGSAAEFAAAMQKFRQFKLWALELDRPHETPNVHTLINVAFFAGEFNRLLTPAIVDDLATEIEEVNEILNRYADKFSPKLEIHEVI